MDGSAGSRVGGDVLLVGSMPFDDVETVLRAAEQELRGHVGCLPDGEVGPRKDWVGMLPPLIFAPHPDLEEVTPPPTGEMEQPEHDDAAPPAEELDGFWTFRIRPGTQLRFDDLLYGGFAKESYDVFRRLREEGAVEEGVRFQLACRAEQRDQRVLRGPRRLAGRAARVHGPPAHGDRRRARHGPGGGARRPVRPRLGGRRPRDGRAQLLPVLAAVHRRGEARAPPRLGAGALGDRARRGAAGLSLVLRDVGRRPMTAMADLGLCVQLSIEAVRRLGAPRRLRPHADRPGPRRCVLRPARDLDTGGTKVFLGLIHETDVEGSPAASSWPVSGCRTSSVAGSAGTAAGPRGAARRAAAARCARGSCRDMRRLDRGKLPATAVAVSGMVDRGPDRDRGRRRDAVAFQTTPRTG